MNYSMWTLRSIDACIVSIIMLSELPVDFDRYPHAHLALCSRGFSTHIGVYGAGPTDNTLCVVDHGDRGEHRMYKPDLADGRLPFLAAGRVYFLSEPWFDLQLG